MVHGPCGSINPNLSCMQNGVCKYFYPKDFNDETVLGDDAYPEYRRRSPEDGGQRFRKHYNGLKVKIDNRNIKQVAAGIWVHPSMIFASKLRLEPKGQCGPLWTYDSQRHRRRDFSIGDNTCYQQSLVNDSLDI